MGKKKLYSILSVVLVLILIPAIVLPIVLSNRGNDNGPGPTPPPTTMTDGRYGFDRANINGVDGLNLDAALRQSFRGPMITFATSPQGREFLTPFLHQLIMDEFLTDFLTGPVFEEVLITAIEEFGPDLVGLLVENFGDVIVDTLMGFVAPMLGDMGSMSMNAIIRPEIENLLVEIFPMPEIEIAFVGAFLAHYGLAGAGAHANPYLVNYVHRPQVVELWMNEKDGDDNNLFDKWEITFNTWRDNASKAIEEGKTFAEFVAENPNPQPTIEHGRWRLDTIAVTEENFREFDLHDFRSYSLPAANPTTGLVNFLRPRLWPSNPPAGTNTRDGLYAYFGIESRPNQPNNVWSRFAHNVVPALAPQHMDLMVNLIMSMANGMLSDSDIEAMLRPMLGEFIDFDSMPEMELVFDVLIPSLISNFRPAFTDASLTLNDIFENTIVDVLNNDVLVSALMVALAPTLAVELVPLIVIGSDMLIEILLPIVFDLIPDDTIEGIIDDNFDMIFDMVIGFIPFNLDDLGDIFGQLGNLAFTVDGYNMVIDLAALIGENDPMYDIVNAMLDGMYYVLSDGARGTYVDIFIPSDHIDDPSQPVAELAGAVLVMMMDGLSVEDLEPLLAIADAAILFDRATNTMQIIIELDVMSLLASEMPGLDGLELDPVTFTLDFGGAAFSDGSQVI